MDSYPSRCKLFALHYAKWLFSSGAAHEVGPDATALLLAVVTLEDEFGCQRPVNFFNEQLMDRCGILSKHALIRARKIAVDAGLLNYAPGKKRQAGKYFVLGFGAENAQKANRKRTESEQKANTSIPTPNPNPFIDSQMDESVSKTDTNLVSFDQFWQAYPPRNGRKLEKPKALDQFRRLKPSEIPSVMQAVQAYSKADVLPKDAFRWLRDGCWHEWLEPASTKPDISSRPEYQPFKSNGSTQR